MVVGATLGLGEDVARAQVRGQVGDAQLGPRRLRLGDGRPHRGIVGDALGEEPAQPRLGGGQAGRARARLAQHRLEQRAHARLLLGRELQAVLELEDVERPWIPVLVGGEGEAEAPAVGDDGVELLEIGVHAAVRVAVVARRVAVTGRRLGPVR